MIIAIADDHFVVRKGLISILTDAYPFAQIDEAGDTAELIKLISKNKYDIIITDLSMPGRSGVEMVKQIKEITPKTPLLVLSNHPPEQFAVRTIRAGANSYLTKESAYDELVKAVETLLNGKKFITPDIANLLADAFSGDNTENPTEILSDREFEVLKLLAQGKTISEVAEHLSLSVNTISTYRARILEKLQLHSTADLIKYALEKKLA